MRSIWPQLENMPYLYLSVPLEIPDEAIYQPVLLLIPMLYYQSLLLTVGAVIM